MEEGKLKKQKFSAGITKELIFFQGKCNKQGNKLGTPQYTFLGCSYLGGQSSDSTAERRQGDRKVKVDGSSEGMETWKSESVRVNECMSRV